MENINKLKMAITGVLGALTAFWGWFGWLLVAWICFMMLDIVTGMAAAAKNGEWASKVARDGLWHKAACIATVTVSGILDLVVGQILATVPDLLPFTYKTLLCPLVLMWYVLTEAGSILENVKKMGSRIPPWLQWAVNAMRNQVDAAAPEKDPSDK